MSLTRHNEQVTPPANAGQSGRGGVSTPDSDATNGADREVEQRAVNGLVVCPTEHETRQAGGDSGPRGSRRRDLGPTEMVGSRRSVSPAEVGRLDGGGHAFDFHPPIRSLRANRASMLALAAQVRAELAGRGVRHPQGGSR